MRRIRELLPVAIGLRSWKMAFNFLLELLYILELLFLPELCFSRSLLTD